MHLQGAIFDMDGTLLDTMPYWNHLASDFVRSLGRTPEPGLDSLLRPMTLLESCEYCRRTYALPDSAETLAAQVNDRAEQFYRERAAAKPGVEQFLSLLKLEDVWMYVATSTDRPLAEEGLRRAALRDFFRGILTSTEVGVGKSSPLIYEKCLTRLRCRKADCVVFEDSLPAARTAKAAGFRVAGVYDPSSEADQPALQQLCDYYIRSFADWIDAG